MDRTQSAALRQLLIELSGLGYEFTTPTPATHARVNARPANKVARSLFDVFGWSRPFAPEIVGSKVFDLLQAGGVLVSQQDFWRLKIRVSSVDGHLYLHSAFPTEEADAVFLGPDTYRFVRAGLQLLPERPYGRAIDLGCGSGAGGLALAARRQIQSLTLSDINDAALAMARVNADAQGAEADIVKSDLFGNTTGPFDLIIANPPYLADPVRRTYRDGGGALGLELGLRILREAKERLAPGGVLYLYTGVPIVDGQDALRDYANALYGRAGCSVSYGEIDPDVFGEELESPAYASVDRIAAISLIVTFGEAD